jgi:hypothetical protein
MRGLDPRIHDETQHNQSYERPSLPPFIMDCRVKPGNDGGENKSGPEADLGHAAFGAMRLLGVELEIFNSSSFMSASTSPNSGVDR